jgi:ADP-ribosylation factor-like protein 3
MESFNSLISSLFTSSAKKKQSLKSVRMCVLGLDNAGKTTILKSLSNEDLQQIMPTQGFNVKSLTAGNFKFEAWDLGGQRAIRTHWKNYYDKVDCLVRKTDIVTAWNRYL